MNECETGPQVKRKMIGAKDLVRKGGEGIGPRVGHWQGELSSMNALRAFEVSARSGVWQLLRNI